MIDQKRAHERILFEHLIKSITSQQSMTQQNLFPEQLEFNTEDSLILKELTPDFKAFGLDLKQIDKQTFEVSGMPVNMEKMKPKELIDEIIESL